MNIELDEIPVPEISDEELELAASGLAKRQGLTAFMQWSCFE